MDRARYHSTKAVGDLGEIKKNTASRVAFLLSRGLKREDLERQLKNGRTVWLKRYDLHHLIDLVSYMLLGGLGNTLEVLYGHVVYSDV